MLGLSLHLVLSPPDQGAEGDILESRQYGIVGKVTWIIV